MEVRVLGTLQVAGAADAQLGPKERVVLARLALGGGAEVTDDALVEALWGDHPPTSAKATLQGHCTASVEGSARRRSSGPTAATRWRWRRPTSMWWPPSRTLPKGGRP